MNHSAENLSLAGRAMLDRRRFLHDGATALGSIALANLLVSDRLLVAENTTPQIDPARPFAPRPAHFPAKAKHVIYLFMAGGPSQLELFSDKPKLRELDGQAPPPSLIAGKRFAFLKGKEKLLGSRRRFSRHGQCGMELSELLPHHVKIVDEVCWLRGVVTDVFNHGPAKLFLNTGFQAPGRPSLGSVVTKLQGPTELSVPPFVGLAEPTREIRWSDSGKPGLPMGACSAGPSGDRRRAAPCCCVRGRRRAAGWASAPGSWTRSGCASSRWIARAWAPPIPRRAAPCSTGPTTCANWPRCARWMA